MKQNDCDDFLMAAVIIIMESALIMVNDFGKALYKKLVDVGEGAGGIKCT